MKPIKPGIKVPDSGSYKEVGTPRRATMVKGEPAPPTTKKDTGWKQVVDTTPLKKKSR
ncbi:MAG: YjzC family protein [Desulfuromonadaceae bacterium]|nr:YjzC family protein [Desulfuromonadaceae bacterium]